MTPQALTGSALPNLIRLLSSYGIDKSRWSKLPALLLWSTLLTPLYFLEKITFLFIQKLPIHPEPIFIIGHWRSGTTYLHYLLANDKQFGVCSNVDAFVPGALFIGRRISRKVMAWRLPKTRPMDDVKLDADAPQEDEFAMMLLTPYSFYHGFVFPRSLEKLFFTYAVLDPGNVPLIYNWTQCYYQYLRKVSYRQKSRRLLLKNPVNTTRIKYLTRIFPKAKFIYLHRDPAEVKQSTLRMFQAMIQVNNLQSFDERQLTQHIELFHNTLVKEYEAQRQYIDPDNLIEINYEDLITAPLQTAKSIYKALKIPGFEASQSAFEQFIQEQKNYKPHQYSYSAV
ncbi:MAG: sulfotransferase [Cyclobacteriaceae bacterium]|nr:sulfotransferase [Cyclobacteriaceae bacterium]MDH4295848.1 sulfotransferase [Cyclobacteriaceae bacterium]MDH5249596.1 sulfotransferase [Cyclobacteriaceae bacterium]